MKVSQAAQFNRRGAALLASGAYDGAYGALAQAAMILRELEVMDDRMASATISPNATVHVTSSLGGCVVVANQDSGFFLFNQTLLFQADDDHNPCSILTEGQNRFCVGIVMFNMALGRHAQAKKLGKDSYMTKALSLYSMAVELLQRVPDQSECLNVLVIVALNNMAEIFFEFGNVAKAKHLLKALNPLSAFLSQATADQCRVDECFLNLLVTNFVETARCA